jgi:hypothetical protein
MDLEVVARAKAYPFDPPASSFVLEDGAVRALDLRDGGRDLAGRRPVLACGSNQSPARLKQKFANGEGPILVTKVTVEGLDAVFAAHIASYGAVPATLIPAPGTRVSLAITWLTPLQERVMHATEAVGVIYDYVRLAGIAAELEDGRRVEPVYAYVNRRGALLLDGSPQALAAVAAEGRVLPALGEPEVLERVRRLLAPERAFDDFVRENVADGDARARRNRALAAYGLKPPAEWKPAAL